jgi:hypothetical protein
VFVDAADVELIKVVDIDIFEKDEALDEVRGRLQDLSGKKGVRD